MAGKITVITSAVQGNGSKFLATNLACEWKRKKKDTKILLVDFDIDNPFLAHTFVKHDEVHGVDNLANNISEEGLKDELFLENLIETKLGVDVLRGTRFIEKSKLLSQLQVEVMLEKARQFYDYIYVVVNCKSNNAGTIVSLMQADQVVLVLRNNYSNMLRVERSLKLIQQYCTADEIFAVYNFKNLNSKLDINGKFDKYPVRILEVIDYEERAIDNSNLEKREPMFSRSVNSKAFSKINQQLWK